MKLIIHSVLVIILSSVALVLPAGCGHEPDDRLLHAEDIIEEHPDSALGVLEGIDVSVYRHKADMALYGLLLTMAMDKCLLEPDNDSLISRAVEYYEKANDISRLIKATYYRGRVQYHKKNNPLSIVDFFRAKELAENSDEYFWAGMSCRGIADIYADTYNAAEELNYARQEYEYILKSGRQPYVNYALYDLGGALHNSGQFEESVDIATQLCDSAEKYDDPNLLHLAGRSKILNFIATDRYDDAHFVSKEVLNSGMAEESDSIDYCEILLEIGRTDEAKKLFDSISDIEPIREVLLKYKLYKSAYNYPLALIEGEKLENIADAEFKKNMKNSLTASLEEYYHVKNKISEADAAYANIRTCLVILLSFFILIVGILLFHRVKVNNRREIEEKILFADQLQEALDKSHIENNHSREVIKSLFSKQYELIEELGEISYRSSSSKDARKKIADRVTTILDEISVSDKKIDSIGKHVDFVCGNIFTDFKKDLPHLKDEDYRLYLFSILGLSSVVMSLFLKAENVSVVYNRKRHLKDKIKTLEKAKCSRYMQYFN